MGVYNSSALLDTSTPEGKAFNVLVEEAKTKKNASMLRTTNSVDLQRYSLLVLYFAADGGSWTNFAGWSTQSDACEAWYGITCQNSLVTAIDLDRNNLYGSIPEDFCLLKDLKVSKLSGNRVTLPSCAFKL